MGSRGSIGDGGTRGSGTTTCSPSHSESYPRSSASGPSRPSASWPSACWFTANSPIEGADALSTALTSCLSRVRPSTRREEARAPRRRAGSSRRLDLDRVVDRRLDLAAVADDAGVVRQPVDVIRPEAGDLLGIETLERLLEPVPLRLDHAPAHPGLEDGLRHHLEVVGETLRLDLLGCLLRLGHLGGALLVTCRTDTTTPSGRSRSRCGRAWSPGTPPGPPRPARARGPTASFRRMGRRRCRSAGR